VPLIFDWDTNALANDARVFVNENVTFDRKQTIGDSPFKWAYSHGITAGLIQCGSFKVNFGAGGYIPSETGGDIQRRRGRQPARLWRR
jgi:hypothetical protein